MSDKAKMILNTDYPDIDVIRVNERYYIVSTTMYFMPGCEILGSDDLVNWEHEAYVYDMLEDCDTENLENGKNAYGKGMWAASLRYHKGTFYMCFVANDTGRTYLYRATDIHGPWKKSYIEGFFHDCSLLFDDDDRTYIVYGNRQIFLTELNDELTAPKEGGLHRLIVTDSDKTPLGYEGSHMYKINGVYHIFFIHSLADRWRRTEAHFCARSLTDEFVGGDVFDEDCGFRGSGIAQGGIVDTPDGRYFGILFQDRGGVGRVPYLVPVRWEGDIPVFGGEVTEIPSLNLFPVCGSDDFKTEGVNPKFLDSFGFKSFWQFSHNPDLALVDHDTVRGNVRITTGRTCSDLLEAKNILTQRILIPGGRCRITVDASGLNEGDTAGLCAFIGDYGYIAIRRNADGLFITEKNKGLPEVSVPSNSTVVTLEAHFTFDDTEDHVEFGYYDGEKLIKLGNRHELHFGLDLFTGCRAGLFVFSENNVGGNAVFSNYIYDKN